MRNLIVLLLVLSFAACNPYNKLDTRPPVSAKDSLLLATRCDQTFPVVPEYIEGEVQHDTVFLDPPTEIDLGEAETILVVQGYNVDSLKRALLAECRPKTIYVTRVDTLVKLDSSSAFRERARAEAAIKVAVKATREKEQIEKKYAKYSMYKFGFFAWPIWLVLCLVLYIMAKNSWKLPKFRFFKRTS